MLPALQPTLELAQGIDVNLLSPTLQLASGIDVNLPTPQLASGMDLLSPTLQLASGIDLLSPEKTLAPLNAATEPWVRAVVWTDFRVAVALFVAAPFALLAASVVACRPGGGRSKGDEAALRYMTSYWQASSLLLITVLFNIEAAPIGAATGLIAQAMIALSLWWWADLSGDLDDAPLSVAFKGWRAAATLAAVGGVAVQLPFQPCAFAPSGLLADAGCAAWLEPPAFAADLVGLAPSPALSAIASAACALYAAVLAYYAAVLLPAVGRRGRAPRPGLMDFSPLGAWRELGFVDEQDG